MVLELDAIGFICKDDDIVILLGYHLKCAIENLYVVLTLLIQIKAKHIKC